MIWWKQIKLGMGEKLQKSRGKNHNIPEEFRTQIVLMLVT